MSFTCFNLMRMLSAVRLQELRSNCMLSLPVSGVTGV